MAAPLACAWLLAACAEPPAAPDPAPSVAARAVGTVPASPPGSATAAAPAASGAAAGPAVRTGERARWVSVPWAELPGWRDDSLLAAWPALLRSCERPAAAWARLCESARRLDAMDESGVRQWLQTRLEPWRIEAPDGQALGLATGYFEPLVEASRLPRAGFAVPLHAPPDDLAARKPWFTRAQIGSEAPARKALAGREIAYVADPLDALLLQVQGSGRLLVAEPDGRKRLVRVAFAGHNDQPYRSVARWLVERGAFTLEQASWPAVKAWARANPQRVAELINANPRYVFFREEPLPDPSAGPLGAQGVPLTPGRSLAVDPSVIAYGTPLWVDTTEPQPWVPGTPPPARPLQRLMLAQDTGSAIVGAVRADYFWGWGEGAEDRAGRMKQPLRLWALLPRP